MRIDKEEFEIVRELAKNLDCSVKELIEVAILLTAQTVALDPLTAAVGLRQQVDNLRFRKALTKLSQPEAHAKKRNLARLGKAIQKRAEPEADKGLTHNPFKAALLGRMMAE